MLRVSFDIGGVLSKYPAQFRQLLSALATSEEIELHVITDMSDRGKAVRFVHGNGFPMVPEHRIHCADYEEHGETNKAVLIRQLGIDIHVDDFPGYCAHTESINLFVWPNPNLPYYADEWSTFDEEHRFGRARPKNPNEVLAGPKPAGA